MGFGFVDGERAARLKALDADPPAPPSGVTIRRLDHPRLWEVIDANGRVLNTWATKLAAQRDAGRYQRAERARARAAQSH